MVKRIILALTLFFPLSSYAQTSIHQYLGFAYAQSLRGWFAINPPYDLSNPAQYDIRKDGALIYSLAIEKQQNEWTFGSGFNLNIRTLERFFHSDNSIDLSLVRLGHKIYRDIAVTAIIGTTIFFENEVSFGNSLGIELDPGVAILGYPLRLKWQFAYTDYELGAQGTVDARRYGYTGYLGIIFDLDKNSK